MVIATWELCYNSFNILHMEPEIFGYQGWKREQIASLKRVRENFGIVILFLPMSLIELAISICLTVLLIPFIFSRGINRFLRGIFFIYKKSDIKFIEYAMSQDPIHHTKSAQSYAKEFAEKEDKFLTDFAAKISPFIYGVLTALVTLYLTKKI